MENDFLKESLRFVGFTEKDALLLQRLLEWLRPHLDEMAEVFYRTLLEHPEARQVLKGPEQVERLKGLLKAWGIKVCTGPYDEEYLQLRSRIGRIHVQIGLPQRYMLAAMSVIRQFFSDVSRRRASSPEEDAALQKAIDRILDCELAIMLETYHEDLLGKLGRHERLAALGTMAVTVNHEMKNPLGVLKTSVDAIRRALSGPSGERQEERIHNHLEKLDRNLDKMQLNISSLLEFARHSEPNFKECDVHQVIDEALEESSLSAGVQVVRRYERSIPPIELDPVQMARVFVNLATNAREAMRRMGTLTVSTLALPGGVRVTFQDTGPGVPADLKEQIFQPLWSGRPGGTGMGLAICRTLVEAHRGRIWVEPGGKGATFHVDIPARGESVLGKGRDSPSAEGG